MTQISSYYASVGVKIDKTSISQVDSFLRNIQTKFERFNRNIAKGRALSLKADLDMKDLMKRISRLNNGRTLKIELSISAQSLRAMQTQIRMAINGMVVSPKINPRISSPRTTTRSTGGGDRADRITTRNPTSRTNPWHNPMMLGGGVGAFMRYGAFSLPFVAGAFGLNSLAGKAATLQNQDLAMDVSVGSLGSPGESAQYKKFLDDLGNRLGRTTESMTPFFAQMLSGAKGTELEPHLQEGFASLMEFGSVMGLGTESMKGAIKAFSQMIGKQQIMAEELRGQAAEHLPPVVRMMAEAVTGGDVKALNKMMERGELDPNKHLPLLFKAMRENAQPFMEQYFRTITFWQGKAQKSQEDWMKKFLGSGGSKAIADFYRTWNHVIKDSIPAAEQLGRIFEDIVHYFNAAILAPGEIMDYFSGKAGKDNFMTMLFGDAEGNELMASIRSLTTEFSTLFENMTKAALGDTDEFLQNTKKTVEILIGYLTSVLQGVSDIMLITNSTMSRGTDGYKYASARITHRENISSMLENTPMSREEKNKIMAREMGVWDQANPAPGQPGFMGAPVEKAPLPSLWEFTKSRLETNVGAMFGKYVDNTPTSLTTPDGIRKVEISIKQDPLKVEAVVEARTDAEAVANEVKARIEENDRRVQQNMLSLFPMTMQ